MSRRCSHRIGHACGSVGEALGESCPDRFAGQWVHSAESCRVAHRERDVVGRCSDEASKRESPAPATRRVERRLAVIVAADPMRTAARCTAVGTSAERRHKRMRK